MLTHFYWPVKGLDCHESLSLGLTRKGKNGGKNRPFILPHTVSRPQRAGAGGGSSGGGLRLCFFHSSIHPSLHPSLSSSLVPSLCPSSSQLPAAAPVQASPPAQHSARLPCCGQKPPALLRLQDTQAHRAGYVAFPLFCPEGECTREAQKEGQRGREGEGEGVDEKEGMYRYKKNTGVK